MRKLLIPLIGLVLAGCSNDITTKTDLGEKYIVKESAVTVSAYSWDDNVTYLEESINDYRYYFDGCKTRLSESYCSHWIEDEESKKYKIGLSKAWRDKPTSLVKIKFRPIFTDLNKNKIAKDYETIHCINPNLSEIDKKEILVASGVGVPNKFSTLAFEITKSKVCEKYAKF